MAEVLWVVEAPWLLELSILQVLFVEILIWNSFILNLQGTTTAGMVQVSTMVQHLDLKSFNMLKEWDFMGNMVNSDERG